MKKKFMKKKLMKLRVHGVDVLIGDKLVPSRGKWILVGSIPIKLLRGHVLTYSKVTVLAKQEEFLDKLSVPLSRDGWERELRYQLGTNKTFRRIFIKNPEEVTDLFPVRVNVTSVLANMGWKDNSLCLKRDMDIFYRS